MRLFDTHCHLQDDRIFDRVDEVIGRARRAGVAKMLCCGSDESDWSRVKGLSDTYPEIIPAFGIHPWYIKNRTDHWQQLLETLLKECPHAAVGEIGLDHAVDERDDDDQTSVFISQLAIADKYHRPVSIHCRKAWGALLAILDKKGLPHGGVIHSFSGAPDLIPRFEKIGASISFSGSVTYDRNKKVRASVVAVSEDRLLIETDSPDISPIGIGEGKNEPANIVKVAQTIAGLRGMTVEQIGGITYRNACRVFAKPNELIERIP